MENDSTRCPSGSKAARPKKPRKDFPLYAHKIGRWAKKVLGRTIYFTEWSDDPKGVAALEEWLEQKDDLLAGREPRAKTDGLTVASLCNQFLDHKKELRDNGELNPRTFYAHHNTCTTVVREFRKSRLVTDLRPEDFRKLRGKLSKTRGAVSLRNEMQRVRGIFKFAFDEELVLTPVRFGQGFDKPGLDTVRRERGAHRAEHGARMFEADEIQQILATAKQPLRTMVLLAANTGFGQTDISRLPCRAVNLDTAWLDFPRPKTGIDRRIPLWPETLAAIREWLPMRPKAKDKADAGLMFLTCRRQRWVTTSADGAPKDGLGREFNKVLRRLGLKRPRVSFYALRHTVETIGGDSKDQVAVNHIMGHVGNDMASAYREHISDKRLIAVVEHIHEWLFSQGSEKVVSS